jgi:outer membrane receptor for ferrienterochelin and colicin
MVLAAVATFAPPLAADDVADEADLHFQIGAERYQAGDYRAALEHFLISNRLVRNRNVLYNIARSYEQLKQFPDAHRYYVLALDGETDKAARERVENAVARIGPNVAVIKVETDPPGATVYVDRRDLGPRGNTPRQLAFRPGRYKVIVELAGHEPAESAPVEVRTGEVVPVALRLRRILGTLRVQGDVPGAAVRLDDEHAPPVGTVPCSLSVPPGRHIVFVSHERYQTSVQDADVRARATFDVKLRMTPLKGTLVVNTDERDALIEVDGHPVGFTPAVLSVQAGTRKVRISLSGFRPVEQTVNVRANLETRVDTELRRVEEVAAASRALESVEEAPSSVSIVPTQELRGMAYPTLVEALRGVRGVYVQDDRAYASVGFRGFGRSGDYGNRVLVLQDGHPTNDNWIGSSYVGYDARTDLQDVERIEVVRGPGSVLYGTGAFSGVINVVTRSRNAPTGASVGLSGLEYGIARARGSVNVRLGEDVGFWASVAGAHAAGRDFQLSEHASAGTDGTVRGLDGFEAATTSGRFWYKSLTAQWFYHSRDKQIPTAAYSTLFGDPRLRLVDARGFFELRLEPQLSSSLQLMARAFVNHYRFNGSYPYAVEDGGLYRERFVGSWSGAELRFVFAPVRAVRLTVGAEGQLHFQAHDRIESESDGLVMDRKDPYRIGAAYVLGDLFPSKEVRISAGTRVDSYTTFGSSVNPRAALIFHPYEAGIIKVLGGKAFRAPSIYELYANDGGLTLVASPNLRPEAIFSPELELSHRFSTTWTGVVAGYGNYIRDLIVMRGAGVTEDPNHYANSEASVLTVGGEAELKREWRQGWTVAVSYAFQRSRYLQQNLVPGAPALREVPNAPEHLGAVRGSVPIVSRAVQGTTRVSVEGPRYDRHDRADDPPQQRTDPAVVWDVVLTGEAARPGVKYAIGVYNALDWRYAVPLSREYLARTIPQAGRTFLVSASAEF